LPASAQSQTEGEFWPVVNVHLQFPDHWRLLGFAGLKKGEDSLYQQVNAGLGPGYQWKNISKPHPENINPDKEHTFLFGAGYEYLRTASGQTKYESRFVLEAMPGTRPLSRLFVRDDRNRIEFRWVNGAYSTRYRNDLLCQYDITTQKFRLTPYASAEVFYDGAKSSWNQQQYKAGVEWPYKHVLMVQTYYLRQNCTTCNPAHLNVGGLTLNLFF